jgi:integrase
VTVDGASAPEVDAYDLTSASDYLGLSPDQRYAVASQNFPEWMLNDVISFPPFHPTYGWACRVAECNGSIHRTSTRQLCDHHRKEYYEKKATIGYEQFVTQAVPIVAAYVGWALRRRPGCRVCGSNREAYQAGYCKSHLSSLKRSRNAGVTEAEWLESIAQPYRPMSACSITKCVHDGAHKAHSSGDIHKLCPTHLVVWNAHLRKIGEPRKTTRQVWQAWFDDTITGESVMPPKRRGQISLVGLPPTLKRDIRYAIHRYANTARRVRWVPYNMQRAVDVLKGAEVRTLADDAVEVAAKGVENSSIRSILRAMQFAARSLVLNEEMSKEAGWFDPRLAGAPQFDGQGSNQHRRRPWNLTCVSHRWLRDALWEYLRDEALAPDGKRPCAGTIYYRLTGILLLSDNLRKNRDDHGERPELLTAADARAVKDTWDMWFREQCPIPRLDGNKNLKPAVLTEGTRRSYAQGVRTVLRQSQIKNRTPAAMDSFILNLPNFAKPKKAPRPRPLSYGDFQKLVDPLNISVLETVDTEDVGLADIWLTQAYQGGRISETMGLRLGCVGLVGAAQPYIWRDISKVGVVDYGMPCYPPVYERLLRRQAKTRAKLRFRYSEELDGLDERARVRFEAQWDRTMPLFPGWNQNPDLGIELSQSTFRLSWIGWFEGLGLSGITTHQTRATLATSLLNNGAPPALVRQLLGHYSTEALAHYAKYNDGSMTKYLRQVWAAGPGMDKPGTILLSPKEINAEDSEAAAARIDLTIVPVEHGLCRYGPVVGGSQCPFEKNCTTGPSGPCEHFVLTGADLAYWERKRDAAYHFAEGAPNDGARDYILDQWRTWEPVLTNLREALDELGLLEEAEKLDLRSPLHDYFEPVFSAGWQFSQLNSSDASQESPEAEIA